MTNHPLTAAVETEKAVLISVVSSTSTLERVNEYLDELAFLLETAGGIAVKKFVHNEVKVYGYYYKEFEGPQRLGNWLKINVNNLKTRKEVLQWYLEFNSGGVVHTNEELDKVRRLLKQES